MTSQTVRFDFYTILLLEGRCEDFLFGRKYYDYSNATVLFLPPGQSVALKDEHLSSPKGYLLAFHPDLLSYTGLSKHINDYTFSTIRLTKPYTSHCVKKTKFPNACTTLRRNFITLLTVIAKP